MREMIMREMMTIQDRNRVLFYNYDIDNLKLSKHVAFFICLIPMPPHFSLYCSTVL